MKRIIAFSASLILLLSCFIFTVYAANFTPYDKNEIPSERLKPRLVDAANVIDDAQEEKLLSLLDSKSEELGIDIAALTVASTDGKDPEAYADDYYDYNGFGTGKDRSGILLLISFDPRYVQISTCGKAMNIIKNSDIDPLIDKFYYEIKTEKYSDAVRLYVSGVENEVSEYNKVPLKLLAIAAVAGFIIASIITKSMKAKLTSVRMKASASEYVIPGSLALTASNDAFLYRNVSRTARPKESSSSGGSHTSSSGSSHGGGGRSF